MNIEELLTPERVSFNLKGRTKEEAIDELIDLLFKDGQIKNKNLFKNAVMKREEEFSTGVGNGVGIPHGKSKSVLSPSIALGISREGIDFDSMDGKPTHIIFLIAVPEEANNIHLNVLSYISRRLMHTDVREKLIKSQNYNEIIEAFEK